MRALLWSLVLAGLMVASVDADLDVSRLRANPPDEDWSRARAGDAQAQFRLALRHTRGEGIPRDDAQAARWFLRAAEQGHPEAAARMGVLYSEGRGVTEDHEQSVVWSLRAADLNEADRERGRALARELGASIP